jgi:hypothetical protein
MSRESPHPSKSVVLAPQSEEGTGKAGPAGEMTSIEAARYIEAFALELSSIAKRSRLDFLAYLLDMARIEAERCASRDRRD